MTELDALIEAHRAHGKTTLLVDADVRLLPLAKEPNVVVLSKADRKPEELWSIPGRGQFQMAVLSAKRTPAELYRVMSLLEPMIAPGGDIIIWNTNSNDDTFHIHSDWIRTATPQFVKWTKNAAAATLQYNQQPRSSGKHVISLALFGTDPRYWRALPLYIRAHHALFSGYELRIHHDDNILTAPYGDVLFGLERRGLLKLVRMGEDGLAIGKCRAMLWRLAPLADPDVEYVFCRDVDALPTWRERCAAEEFITSGLATGVIHDNPEHVGMMGGLCHFKATMEWRQMWRTLNSSAWEGNKPWQEHGTDQTYLNETWSLMEIDPVLEHSLFIISTETGEWIHRDKPTLPNADFRTKISDPSQEVIDSVAATVRTHSDSFINYMGAAGRRDEEALAFYSDPVCYGGINHGGHIIDAIREAENLAGYTP